MSVSIDPNAIYLRDELIALLGEPMLNSAVRAGLRAIGDRYLGAKVLEYVDKAHGDRIKYHQVKKRSKHNEEAVVETDTERDEVHSFSGGGGASDFHRKMAAMC